jgi:hypothetical protein
MTQLRVAINDEIRVKTNLHPNPDTPEAKRARVSLTYRYGVRDLNLEGIAECLRQRMNIAAIFCNRQGQFHRKKENFVQADMIGVDFDNDGAVYLSFEDARQHSFIKEYCAILYTTPSHREDYHKFRALFWLPETFTNRERTERLIVALIWKFQSDESCKDVSRFFYGSGEGGTVLVLGNRLTTAAVDGLLKEYELAHPANEPLPHEPTGAESWSGYTFGGDDDARRAMHAKRGLDIAARIINGSHGPIDRKSGTGNRHDSRLRAARLLGGYIAGSIIPEYEARAALESLVRANTDNFQAAWQTIEDGLSYGKASPIPLERLDAEYAEYRRRHPRPNKKRIEIHLEPVRRPTNTVTLEPPARPVNTIQLPKATRPAVTTEVAR